MSETVEIELRGAYLHRVAAPAGEAQRDLRQMERELCDAVASPEVQRSSCVVFTGGPDVFSAGADLSVTRGYAPEEIVAHYQGTGDFAERVAAPAAADAERDRRLLHRRRAGVGARDRLPDRRADRRVPVPRGRARHPPQLGSAPCGRCGCSVPLAAKELILLRDRVDANDAFRLGLVTELVADGPVAANARSSWRERLAQLPPHARERHQPPDRPAARELHAAGLELERLATACSRRPRRPAAS